LTCIASKILPFDEFILVRGRASCINIKAGSSNYKKTYLNPSSHYIDWQIRKKANKLSEGRYEKGKY